MYTFPGRETRYLSNLERYNYGVPDDDDAPTVRFPDDKFDRLWWNYIASGADKKTTRASTRPNNNTRADLNNVPAKVMQDAEGLSYSLLYVDDVSVDTVYAAVYFQDLNATESSGPQVVTINVYTDGNREVYASPPCNVTANPSMQVFPALFVEKEEINFDFTGTMADRESVRPPVNVNALEIYGNYPFDYRITDQNDQVRIRNLQSIFNLGSWNGDPCTPVPYEWLTCTLFTQDTQAWFVKNITLSHLDKNGWPALINSSPSPFINVFDLSLTHSYINDNVFQFLVQNFSQLFLGKLNLSYNVINDIPTSSYWGVKPYFVSLDLSHNALNKELSFLTIPLINTLQILNVSDNMLNGVFPDDIYFSNIMNSSFEIVNFDRNDIHGSLNLSAWQAFFQQNISIGPLFSFVSNNITTIDPSIEDFEAIIASRLQNQDPNINKTGVLKKNDSWHIILGTIGGVLFFVVCCVLLAISLKLQKQVATLKQFQQALADQKVQPLFFSYNELKLATRDFHKDNKLGSGAFGVVYKGELTNGTTIAIKRLFNSQQVQVLNDFLNEVVLITGIKHKNLVQLKGCCINDKQRLLIYEHVENGNLAEALLEKQTSQVSILEWKQRFNISLGVARGLSYLHEELHPRIIHRDIKPANILLDKNFNPKIADFGLARHVLDEHTHAIFTNVAGTRGYFAPEYASEGKLTEKADVYSFGILVLEIVSGRKVIDYNMPSDQVFLKDWVQNLYKDGMLLESLQLELQNNCVEVEVVRVLHIALICVQMDFEKRPTMSQVVTMLLGSMDVTMFLDNGNYHLPNFGDLTPGNQSLLSNISTLHEDSVIEEQFNESPSLQIDIGSTMLPQSNLRDNSIATIDLSDLSGR